MDITLVKKLRADTGLSIKDCTKAAKETESYDEAIFYLRQRNKDLQDKRANNDLNAGATATFSDHAGATIILLGSETDFVSGNEEFKKEAHDLCMRIHEAHFSGNYTEEELNENITDIAGRFRENVKLVDTKHLVNSQSERVQTYNHGNIAVAVVGTGSDEDLRKVAMHIAASSPLPRAITADGLDSDFLAQEKKLVEGSEDVQSKPENIREKIVAGKMNKVYKNYCLLDQEMLTSGDDAKQTVGKWASANNVSITEFVLVSMK